MEKPTRPEPKKLMQGEGHRRHYGSFFAAMAGLVVGVGFFKFGNPVIFEGKFPVPRTVEEVLYQVWPIHWVYYLVGGLFLAGLPLARFKRETPRWAWILPVLWLGWEIVAATQSVDVRLSETVLWHMTASVICFFIGWTMLSEVEEVWPFWVMVGMAFLWLMRIGFEQHFGGLEATRKYFEMYLRPKMGEVPPDLIRRFSTTRIFGTLFYPNSFAGIILLFLPGLFAAIWEMPTRIKPAIRMTLMAVVGVPALLALFWSGSKAGWLLLLGMAVVLLFRVSFNQQLKRYFVILILIGGLAGFAVKYAGFFRRGATSVTARFDYWQVAAQVAAQHPWVGTGPGTFSIPYRQLKRAESEMARLCHNDYLEQASDSGIVGFLAYSGFIIGSLVFLYRKCGGMAGSLFFSIWLGIAGWAAHSFLEFHLYIPALAYPFFLMMGWLWGSRGIRIDISQAHA